MSMMAGNPQVTLNVGGTFITTTYNTLTRFPYSKLARMITESESAPHTEGSCLFIDRDPVLFRLILNYLRSGRVLLPENYKELDLLRQEAAYYELNEFVLDLPAPEATERPKSIAQASVIHRPPPGQSGMGPARPTVDFLYVKGHLVEESAYRWTFESAESVLREIARTLNEPRIVIEPGKYVGGEAKRYKKKDAMHVASLSNVMVILGFKFYSFFQRERTLFLHHIYVRYH